MPRLPWIDWPDELIEQRIAFLKAVARFMPPAHSGDREPLPSAPATDVKALVAAADLALATGRTRDGLNSLQEAVIAIVKGVGDRRAAALPGAIIGNVRTTLGDRIEMEPPLSLLWSFELDPGLTPAGLRLNTDLLFASIASNSKRLDRFDQLGLPRFRTNESIVQALVVFDDIGSFEGGRSVEARYRSAQGALGANAVQWAQDLQLNKDDTYHWEARPCTGCSRGYASPCVRDRIDSTA